MKLKTKMTSATGGVLLMAIVNAVTGVTAHAQYIAPEPLAGSGTIDTRFGTLTFEQGNPTPSASILPKHGCSRPSKTATSDYTFNRADSTTGRACTPSSSVSRSPSGIGSSWPC